MSRPLFTPEELEELARIDAELEAAPVTADELADSRRRDRAAKLDSMDKRTRRIAELASWQLRPVPTQPIDYPVNVQCLFYMQTHRRVDGLNLMAAIDDLLVDCGILADDNSRIVAAHDGSRVLYDPDSPRVEITITPMQEDDQMGLFAGDGHERF